MADKESRQCPHFNISDGVCGCPEFWRPAQLSQHDQSFSTLQDASSACYSKSAPNRQVSSSVNSIPLPDRNNIQQVTPAPPGPPKETCFFWYHGSCRRGDDCERPHEAHSTWPIPPPPGFRHYQPCTLPLCPLRSDLASSGMPQEYQRRRRTIDGQMDGAAFSRATTAGESSSDSDSNSNTETDMSEIVKDMYATSADRDILGPSIQDSSSFQGSANKGYVEGATWPGEVNAEDLGRNGPDESDYADLSQLLSPSLPSTPLVKEETLLSISHSGTLSKRRHPPTTKSPRSKSKRVKLEEASATELDKVISLFERPRTMSQWDIKPPSSSLHGQNTEPAASYLAALHGFPKQSLQPVASNNGFASFVSSPFNPPEGHCSMGTLPPICFFYYHKGRYTPKNGRKSDYLHDKSTPQQTVSLTHGIDNHDPSCALPPCPVHLRRISQVKQEQDAFIAGTQDKKTYQLSTPPRMETSPFFEISNSSPRDPTMSVQGRPPGVMIGRPLPQLTG
ncbi:uncharacterized protein M421DRAFT_4368 [Didymella exigua CBS 183.55]|uniref:C3H1-type domain-containing protein n=1 Tax=Didymella exigua CBS 183.55 TaxID=1150837 RepID=A0A6A5RPW0_9PLEO|nr:uncharacterized protein M421DRAFT_4368 [Didymella exigua CBS 183.55]KAF1929198.1 hypothetical protein M421DRAFT_4368 [Didymella exigua CBS 183.55]